MESRKYRLLNFDMKFDPIHDQVHIELQKLTDIAKPGRYIILEVMVNPGKYETFSNWIENHCAIVKGRFLTERRFIGSIINPIDYSQYGKHTFKYVLPC